MAALLVCMVPLRSFGGGCAQAPGGAVDEIGFVLRCTRERSWRLAIRGASYLAVLLGCMVPGAPSVLV